jgi:predicted ATPase
MTREPAAHGDGFVGRAVELQRIAELLAREECRLLCLVGPGGVGKTRLARRAMAAVADRFADGASFVELEDAETPAHAAQRLADALDVRAGTDALRATTAALAGRHMLLVLDNVEQLAENAAVLIEPILAAAPRVKLLVTSRVRLPVALAWSMPLDGLPVPDPEDDDHAESFDAIRLFVQAAQRVSPVMSWHDERGAIVDICRQLEGLPLAIELAAAWTRVLSCADIAAELLHGHELLRAQDAARPARHASIGVVFDESWRRLSAAERRALARLSVFRGGFTVEAARAVAGAALPVLGALVDKSLLRKDESAGRGSGQARLALHPLLQQLAADKLDDEGAVARHAAEAAHAAYFHAWLARVRLASEQGQSATLAAIEVEIENCRQAWAVAIASGDADAITHSAPTLLHLVEHRARFEDGLALWQQAIDAPLADAPPGQQRRLRAKPDEQPPLRALLLAQAALLEYRLARFDAAQARAKLALAGTSNAADDLDARYQALSVLASCAMSTGRFAEARRLFLRTLALARARAWPHEIAGTLENLALATKRLGDYEASLRLNVEALAEHRRSGAGAGEALSLSNLASLEMFMGRNDAAAGHLREALVLCERHGLTSTHVLVLANLTELTIAAGDDAQARMHAERAFEIAQGAGMRAVVGWLEIQRSRLSLREGRVDDARDRLAAGCTLALDLHLPSLKAAALRAVAELFEALDRPGAARRVLDFGIEQESLSAPDRAELRAQRASRGPLASDQRAWPGMSLDELLRRVAAECTPARARLIAELG